MSKVFIDTNILVYSMDQFDPAKQQKCRSILKTVSTDLSGVVSTQVLQEFYVAATRAVNNHILDKGQERRIARRSYRWYERI